VAAEQAGVTGKRSDVEDERSTLAESVPPAAAESSNLVGAPPQAPFRKSDAVDRQPAGAGRWPFAKGRRSAAAGDPPETAAEQPDSAENPPAAAVRSTEADPDLAAALAAAAPRRWWNRATPVLGGTLLIAVGFLGGVQAQQHWGTAKPTSGGNRNATAGSGFPGNGQPGARASGFPNAPSGFPGGPVGGASGFPDAGTVRDGRRPTTGTVVSIQGTTLTVLTDEGSMVTVLTADSTAVRTTASATLATLKAGQAVSVDGSASSDGTITATTVTASK
jgi:hypothetical protein